MDKNQPQTLSIEESGVGRATRGKKAGFLQVLEKLVPEGMLRSRAPKGKCTRFQGRLRALWVKEDASAYRGRSDFRGALARNRGTVVDN